jgi:heme/copper-type cytochrome/quinol oxidase subunit 2
LLLAFVTTPFATFYAVRSNAQWLKLDNQTPLEQTLVAALVAVFVGVVILLVLVAELAMVIKASKHRRIIHYSNQHPYLSPRFLWENTSTTAKIIGALVPFAIYGAGYASGAARAMGLAST